MTAPKNKYYYTLVGWEGGSAFVPASIILFSLGCSHREEMLAKIVHNRGQILEPPFLRNGIFPIGYRFFCGILSRWIGDSM